MNKKGISTIVATVLIVLITVAAVTILWAAIAPLLDIQADTGCFNVQTAVKVDGGQFSVVPDMAASPNNTANVRVARSGDSAELTGVVISVERNGSLVANVTLAGANLPGANGAKVQPLTTPTGTVFYPSDKVRASVAPQMTIDGETVTCTGSAYVDLINRL